MDWQDQGFVLVAKRHGESDAVVTALTRLHGRHLGLVKGGASRTKRPALQPGNLVAVEWRARLAEQLGHFQIEPVRAIGALLFDDARRLAALAAICATIEAALPEREPHADIYDSFAQLIQMLEQAHESWPANYVRWESGLLSALGFGLDLTRCALTGVTLDLAYVSPRTGRAASLEAGRPFQDKLLRLPPFLVDDGARPARGDLEAGLRLTGHFLNSHVFAQSQKSGLVDARDRLVELLCRDQGLG